MHADVVVVVDRHRLGIRVHVSLIEHGELRQVVFVLCEAARAGRDHVAHGIEVFADVAPLVVRVPFAVTVQVDGRRLHSGKHHILRPCAVTDHLVIVAEGEIDRHVLIEQHAPGRVLVHDVDLGGGYVRGDCGDGKRHGEKTLRTWRGSVFFFAKYMGG